MTSVFLRASCLAPFISVSGAPASRALSSAHLGSFDNFDRRFHSHATFSLELFPSRSAVFISYPRLRNYYRLSAPGPPSCRAITRTSIVESTEEAQTDYWHSVIWSCVARPLASPSAASATNATANAPSATVTSAPQPSSASATNAPSETTKTNVLSAVAR